jgi:hypothetical protein
MGSWAVSLLSAFGGIVVLLAFVVIYIRTQSPWILGALVAEAVTLAMRLGFGYAVQNDAIREIYMAVWQLAGLAMAVCLLAYAINLPPLRKSGQ